MSQAPLAIRRAPHELLALRDIEQRPVRLAMSVYPTILAAVDALGGRDRHVDPALMRSVAGSLTARDRAVLRPVILRPGRFVPSSLLHPAHPEALTPADELEQLDATAPEDFVAELETLGDFGPWADAVRAPARWLAAYQRALERCWQAIEPFWREAAPALEREGERVAAALARGTISDLIVAAQPAGAVADGTIAFPSVRRDVRLSAAGLTLTPKLIGSPAHSLRFYDGDAMTHLAYRAPGVPNAVGRATSQQTLVALLGAPRAMILRELDRPRHVGDLAQRLLAVPSAATHHVDALQDAGLVRRDREGRYVMVRRTARGTALLALYER